MAAEKARSILNGVHISNPAAVFESDLPRSVQPLAEAIRRAMHQGAPLIDRALRPMRKGALRRQATEAALMVRQRLGRFDGWPPSSFACSRANGRKTCRSNGQSRRPLLQQARALQADCDTLQ